MQIFLLVFLLALGVNISMAGRLYGQVSSHHASATQDRSSQRLFSGDARDGVHQNHLRRRQLSPAAAPVSPITPGTDCTDSEGLWNCLSTTWQRCGSGRWSHVVPCPHGTMCLPGGLSYDFHLASNGLLTASASPSWPSSTATCMPSESAAAAPTAGGVGNIGGGSPAAAGGASSANKGHMAGQHPDQIWTLAIVVGVSLGAVLLARLVV